MRKGASSDIGRMRTHNEDSFCIDEGSDYFCAIVADGMGGHLAGEIASSIAVSTAKNFIADNMKSDTEIIQVGEIVRSAVEAANRAVYQYAVRNSRMIGMGTTLTLAMLYKDKIISANVGDSRTYFISSKEIEQITTDHSYVAELVARGDITPQQAKTHPKRNYITRAIGTEPNVNADINIIDYKGQTVLLCSDGLYNMINDEELHISVKNKRNLQRCAERLVNFANKRGGTDNITVVLYRKDR